MATSIRAMSPTPRAELEAELIVAQRAEPTSQEVAASQDQVGKHWNLPIPPQ